MSNYWGFDTNIYPGNAAMSAWHNTYSYVGFYLAPAPNHTNTSWMNKKSYLDSLGYGYLPVFVGRQYNSSNLNNSTGILDAQAAAQLAYNAGFQYNSYIYLDIEQGGTLSNAFITYIKAWIKEIEDHTNYSAGVYCSYTSAQQINNEVTGYGVRFWVYHIDNTITPGSGTPPNPTNSGYAYARIWQFKQNTNQTINGYTINADYNTSMYSDPSN